MAAQCAGGEQGLRDRRIGFRLVLIGLAMRATLPKEDMKAQSKVALRHPEWRESTTAGFFSGIRAQDRLPAVFQCLRAQAGSQIGVCTAVIPRFVTRIP